MKVPTTDGQISLQSKYREVLDQLEQAGIQHCLLRDRLDSDSEIKDLDLLVSEASQERLRDKLRESGFVEMAHRGIPFKAVFARYDGEQALCLDVHWRAVQYGIIYMDSSRMLTRRLRQDGLFYLSQEDELIHRVWHSLLRKGPFSETSLKRMGWLLTQALDWGYICEHQGSLGFLKPFSIFCEAFKKTTLMPSEEQRLRRDAFRAAFWPHPTNLGRYLAYRIRWIGARSRRGGLVAIVGPDGAGKSSVAAEIKKRSRAIPALKIETVYLGPWGQMESPWMRVLCRYGISITPSREPWGAWLMSRFQRKPVGDGRFAAPPSMAYLISKWLKSLARGTLFYLCIYAELLFRYLKLVLPRLRKGYWIVSDRYITDLRYLYIREPMLNYPFLRFLVCWLFPKPDLFILLDNRPDVIFARKDQLTLEQIRTCRELCFKAIEAVPHQVIQTDRPVVEIATRILQQILLLSAQRL